MRAIVTGGSGFTGAHLCRALVRRNREVVVFDLVPPPPSLQGKVRHVAGDIRSAQDLARLELGAQDEVFHLAARQFHGPVPARDRQAWFSAVNVEGTRLLLEAMETGGAHRLVFFSTDMTYGRPLVTPVGEEHPQHPIGPYGRSKLAAERLLLAACAQQRAQCAIFRPRLIAGSGRLGILVKLFRLVRLGLPTPMIGSGRNRYQMVAVEDCVRAALLAAERGFPTGPFNLGSDNPPTVRELLAELIARAGSRSTLLPTPVRLTQALLRGLDACGLTLLHPEQFAIADADYVLDTRRVKTVLGWSPTRQDGEILFEAYRECWSAPTREPELLLKG